MDGLGSTPKVVGVYPTIGGECLEVIGPMGYQWISVRMPTQEKA